MTRYENARLDFSPLLFPRSENWDKMKARRRPRNQARARGEEANEPRNEGVNLDHTGLKRVEC